MGGMGGQVVRMLAFHFCDPGIFPGLTVVICGLSLFLLFVSHTTRVFSLGSPVYIPQQ